MSGIPFVIYRDVILPLSETFIAAPASFFRRYQPWFTGTKIRPHALIDSERVIQPAELGDLPRWREGLFKSTGMIPNEWLGRIRAREPHLLHAHFGTDGVFAAPIASRLGIPLVVTFHGFDATIRSANPVWKYYEHQRRRLYRRATRILAVSEFIRKRLIDAGCPPALVETHYLGVDTELFQRSSERQSDKQEEQFVLFVGRLVEKKGCSDLIEAIRRLRTEERSLRLVIIGDGPLRSQLERQAEGLEVSFLGACDPAEVKRWMERASIFALASRTARSGDAEGLPIVILEAQSMGIPVVSTLHAGIPEAVVHEETGLLCSEGDVDRLAAHILLLSGNESLRRKMGVAARARMRALFDLRQQTEKLEMIYDRVLFRCEKR